MIQVYINLFVYYEYFLLIMNSLKMITVIQVMKMVNCMVQNVSKKFQIHLQSSVVFFLCIYTEREEIGDTEGK